MLRWNRDPLNVERAPDGTVTVRFLLTAPPGTVAVARAAALPHTFQLQPADAAATADVRLVANRRPTAVAADAYGRLVGTWVVPPRRWRAEPLWTRRTAYETVTAAFEPDDPAVRYPREMAAVPHTFRVAGVDVTARPPDAVRSDRAAGGWSDRCPCYGLWYVNAPLTGGPQWSPEPMDPPPRAPWWWSNTVRTVAFEWLFPLGTDAAAGLAAAGAAVHRFSVGGVTVERVPDEVFVDPPTARVVGRWRVPRTPAAAEPWDDDAGAGGGGWWVWWALAALAVVAAVVWCRRGSRGAPRAVRWAAP